MVAPHRPQNVATLTIQQSTTPLPRPNIAPPEVTTATTNAALSRTFTPTTLLEPEISQYTTHYEDFVDEQPVRAIDDSDTLGQLPGGGNQILIIDEQVKNQWKTKK